jgi:ATP-binding cassette subfamily F protein 3
MAVAILTNIEKTFGRRLLFEKLNLTVYEGERVGLLGDNGSGKTSLFRAIVGQLSIDGGEIAISRSTRVGYLTQDPVFDPANTVMDEAELAFEELHRLSHRLRQLEHDMAGLAGDPLDRILRQYQQVQHEFDLAGGYAWRHRLEATLLGIGLDRPCWDQSVQTLSGGQRSRLALAKLLISEPGLLLLDEPTNHLDLDAIEWLEDYLGRFSGAVVLVSHDRYLLDRLATRIVWLNQCKLDSFSGNYSAFVRQRELRELTQERAFERQQAGIEKELDFIRRFGAGQRAREARGRRTRLERLLKSEDLVQRVQTRKAIRLSLDTQQRAGDIVLTATGLAKSYGDRLLWRDLSLRITRGQRVGMVGPNGSGKTTLLEVLLGMREPDEGTVRLGANLNIGYYDQRLDDFDPDSTVFDEVRGQRDLADQQVRDVLALMLFRGEDVHKAIGLLSGGERARVRLAQLLLDRPNLLVLDEPTNHLDVASREALEGALREFSGTILCVSHDRYFLDRVVGRLWVLRPPACIDFAGNYSAWAAREHARRLAQEEAARRSAQEERRRSQDRPRPKPESRPDNPYLRPFGLLTLAELEEQIAQTETRIKEHESLFADPEALRDPVRARQIHEQYEQAAQKLAHLEEEYFLRE